MTKSDLIESLDPFTRAYIDCALWCGVVAEDESYNHDEYDIDQLMLPTLRGMIDDCREFQRDNAEDLAAIGKDERSGHNFYLTRNRHGAGFWDDRHGALGGRLTQASHYYGEDNLFLHRGRLTR